MTRTDAIITAVTYELSRQRAAINAGVDLNSLMIVVKLRPDGQPKKVIISPQSESATPGPEEMAALAQP